MANIESYLNQRMYDETVEDLAKSHGHGNRNLLTDSDDEASVDSPGVGSHLDKIRQHQNFLHASQLETSAPSFTFPRRRILRQGVLARLSEDYPGPNDPGGDDDSEDASPDLRVASWLATHDFKGANSFAFKRNMLAGGGSPQWSATASRRPMIRSQPLVTGTWKDRCKAWLAALNSHIPIFSPFSSGRKLWESFIMVLVLYNAITVPLDISYGMPDNGNIALYIEYAVDLIFAIDICGNFRTCYVDSTGYLVRDTGVIARNYLKMWFWIDLFATIPYDLLAEAVLKGDVNSTQVTVLGFLRTPRLLRLGRLVRMLDRLKSANLIRVIMVMVTMMLISHWLACIWYMLFKFTTFADHAEWGIFLGGLIESEQTVSAYLSAYYQSFLMMVGNNQTAYNNLERLFMILVLIMGACFYSAMVGQMAVLVANMNTVALRHRMKQDTTMDVLRYLGLPESQLIRVQNYFSYIMQVNHPAAEGLAFLQDLPKALLEDITDWLYGNRLSRVHLFSGLETAFLSSLALRMRIVSFTPKEIIFREGDLGIEMYIIRKGCVAVVGKHNQMLAFLGEGDYFGEIAMFTMAKRTAKCVALANCDLCVLNTYDLKLVMKDFPASSQALTEKAHQKLRQLQVAGRAAILDTEDDDEDYEEDAALLEEEEEEQEVEAEADGAEVELDDVDDESKLRPLSSPGVKPGSGGEPQETGAISGRTVRRASIADIRRASLTWERERPMHFEADGPVGEGLELQGLQSGGPVLVTIHEHGQEQEQPACSADSQELVPVGRRRRKWLATAAMAVWRTAQRSNGVQPVAEGTEGYPVEHSVRELTPTVSSAGLAKGRGQDNALAPKPKNSFRNGSLPHTNLTLGSAPTTRLPTDLEDDGGQEWLRTALSNKGNIKVLNSMVRGGLTPDNLQSSQRSRLGTDSPSGLMTRSSYMPGKKSGRSSAASIDNYAVRASPSGGGYDPAAPHHYRPRGSVDDHHWSPAHADLQMHRSLINPRRSQTSDVDSEGAAAAKAEVFSLRQQLAEANKSLNEEADVRKLLFRHLVSLLQLLEHMCVRVDGMETWMHDMEGHVKRMEVTQHGTSNVLGAHIEAAPQPRPGLSRALSKRGNKSATYHPEQMLSKRTSLRPDVGGSGGR